jgi:hypothetical protein
MKRAGGAVLGSSALAMRVVEEQAVRSPEDLASKTGLVSCQSRPVDPAIGFRVLTCQSFRIPAVALKPAAVHVPPAAVVES